MRIEQLVLVDKHGRELGVGEKLKTHIEGTLHRAFSIFVFDDTGRLLLQKRAQTKYHSGGLWSNTCCGHPRPGEQTFSAAKRRLREEMNFECEMHEFFTFRYRAKLPNNLIENEYDHVFVGKFNGSPAPDITEVEDWKWMSLPELTKNLRKKPSEYSYWLREALKKNEWRTLDDFLLGF
jgi:isopentenyl-diphosphate Delta-isomerase